MSADRFDVIVVGAGPAGEVVAGAPADFGEVTLTRVGEAVPAFPTRSEAWLSLLAAWQEPAASGPAPAPRQGQP